MINVLLLGLTSLLADFSSEMVVPILPFFIQSIGGAGVAIGLVFGVGDAVAALLKVVSGNLADRTKKFKLFVFLGYLFSAISKFAYPIASQWFQVGAIRAVERLGKGFRDAPRDAILSESLSGNHRGLGFGIQRTMDSLGAILGSVIVLVLFVYAGLSFRTIFLVSAVVALFAVIPIIFVKSPEVLRRRGLGVSFKRLSKPLRKFFLVASVFALANFSVAFMVITAQGTFADLDFRTALEMTLFLYIFLGIFDAGFSGPAGALSDRIGRKKVIMASYLIYAAVSLGFVLLVWFQGMSLSNFLTLLILFALYGLFKATIDASQRAFVSDLSDPEIRGTALGAFETLIGLIAIPASVMAGFLWNLNPLYTFSFGLMLSLAAAFMLWKFIPES